MGKLHKCRAFIEFPGTTVLANLFANPSGIDPFKVFDRGLFTRQV